MEFTFEQAVAASCHNDTTTQLCDVIHHAASTCLNCAQMLKITVIHHYASVITAAPELLVDDSQSTWGRWRQLLLSLFLPRFAHFESCKTCNAVTAQLLWEVNPD